MKKYVVLLFVLFLVSCNNSKKQSVFNLLKEWNSREIQFPNHLVFYYSRKRYCGFSY